MGSRQEEAVQDESVARGCCGAACSSRDAGTDAHSDAHSSAAMHCLHAGLSVPTRFTSPWQQCLCVSEPRNSQAQRLSTNGKQCHPLQAPIGIRMKLPMFDVFLKAAAESTKVWFGL